MQKYKLRFFFEWSDDYLWAVADDPFTQVRFESNIDPHDLGVSQALIDRLDALSDEYQTSLDWEYPPDPSPWPFEHFLDFDRRTLQAVTDLAEELKDICDLNDEHGYIWKRSETIIREYEKDPEGYDRILTQLLNKRYSWDGILRALLYILYEPSDDMGRYRYAANMIESARLRGMDLGIDKAVTAELLTRRLGDTSKPHHEAET